MSSSRGYRRAFMARAGSPRTTTSIARPRRKPWPAPSSRMGGKVRVECPVTDLVRDGDRITGARTAQETISAAEVVVAAGAWSAQFEAAAGVPLPVFPAKGQIVVARLPRPASRHVVYEEIYVIPRATGEHIIGSTVEYVGLRQARHVGGDCRSPRRRDEARARPARRRDGVQLRVPAAGVGRRPAPSRAGGGETGLIVATGHFRNGILLSPITGTLIAELIVKGETTMPLTPFRPDRPFPPGPPPAD